MVQELALLSLSKAYNVNLLQIGTQYCPVAPVYKLANELNVLNTPSIGCTIEVYSQRASAITTVGVRCNECHAEVLGPSEQLRDYRFRAHCDSYHPQGPRPGCEAINEPRTFTFQQQYVNLRVQSNHASHV